MSTVPITPSTSVVLINVGDYAPNDPVVLFGKDAAYGKLVTVRDKAGTASEGTPIYISTSADAVFTSDVSGDAFTIDQPFGSATLMYKGENPDSKGEWAIVNTFAYPSATVSATFQEVYVSSLTVDSGKFIYDHDGDRILELYSTLFDLSADIRMNDFDISGAGYIYTQNIDTDYLSSATAEINELTVESTLAEYIDATVISTIDLYAEAFSTIDAEIKDLQASTIWASDLIEADGISTNFIFSEDFSTVTGYTRDLEVSTLYVLDEIEAGGISTNFIFSDDFSTVTGYTRDLEVSTLYVLDLIEADGISTNFIFTHDISTVFGFTRDFEASSITADFLDIDAISTTRLGADFISSFAISSFSLMANRVTVSSLLNVRSSIVTPNFYTSSILLQEANTAAYVPIANQHRITVSSGFARLNNEDIYVIPRLISTHNLFLSSINLSTIGMRDIITGTREVIESKNDELYYNNSTIQIAAPFFSTVGYIASTFVGSTISTVRLFTNTLSTTSNIFVGGNSLLSGWTSTTTLNASNISVANLLITPSISTNIISSFAMSTLSLGASNISLTASLTTPWISTTSISTNSVFGSTATLTGLFTGPSISTNTISTNVINSRNISTTNISTNTLFGSMVSTASNFTQNLAVGTVTPLSGFLVDVSGSAFIRTLYISTLFASTQQVTGTELGRLGINCNAPRDIPYYYHLDVNGNAHVASNFYTSSLFTSTAFVSSSLQVGTISTVFVRATNISTNTTSTNSVIGSTIALTNSLTAPWISTTNISTNNVLANSISTTTLSTNTLFAGQASTNSVQTRDLSATNLAFLNSAQISTLNVSSMNVLSTVTNTLTAFASMGTISTFTSSLHVASNLNVGNGFIRMNVTDNRVGIGNTTTRVEISGNYIRHNAQLSNILATPNITMFQNNTGANIEIYEGTTTAPTKNATLTVTRTAGTSTKFYSEDVQSNTGLRVGQGFLGGNGTIPNTYGIQYGANTDATTGIYMSSGVGINTRQNMVAGAALTVNGQTNLSTTVIENTGLPLRIFGPGSNNVNNSSTIIQFIRVSGNPNPQTAILGHCNIASDNFMIQTTRTGGDLILGTTNYKSGVYIQDSTKNVGIGTPSPQFNLDVSGTLYASTMFTSTIYTSTVRLATDTSGIYQGMYLSSGRLMLENRALAFTTDTQSNAGGIASIPLNLSVNTIFVSTVSSQQVFTSTLTANGLTTLINQPTLRRWVGGGGGGLTTNCIEWSDNGSDWNLPTNDPFSPISVNAVMYDGTKFIAGAGIIATSTDGKSWTAVLTPPTPIPFSACYDIKYDGRTYIAGCAGTRKILTSSDGVNWNANTTTVFSACYGLATNGRIWVGVGSGINSIGYSRDNGATWTGINTIGNTGWTIDWNGIFFLMGGVNVFAYSYDGISWFSIYSNISSFLTTIYDVTWNGIMWVACGEGTYSIAYSYDGINWSAVTNSKTDIFTARGRKAVWNGNLWVAGGQSSTNASHAISVDGINWTSKGNGYLSVVAASIAYSSNITPDLQMSNFGIYSQGVPNYTTSTNQLLITSTTAVLNNSLFVNNATANVGINIIPSAGIALDVNGNLRNSGQALLSSISTNLVSSMFLNTSNLTTMIENSRILNTSSIFASTLTVSSINTSTINTSTILAFHATLASTFTSALITNHISSQYGYISSIAMGTNSNVAPLHISTISPSSIVIHYPVASGQAMLTTDGIKLGNGRNASGNENIDFVGDTTYTNFGLRISRGAEGANASTLIAHRGTGNLNITAQEAAPIIFNTTNAERMRVTATGSVGIGITNPSSALEVRGSVYASEKYIVEKAASSSAPDYTFNGDTGTGLYSPTGNAVALATQSLERFRINSAGLVGIGTNNPTIFLDVNGAGRMASLSTSIISTQSVLTSSISTTFIYTSSMTASNVSTNALQANNVSTAQILTSSVNANFISSQMAQISTLSTTLIYTSTIATMLMSTARFEAGELAFNTGSFTNLAVSGSGTISNNWSSNVIVAGGTGGTHTLAYSTNNGSNWTGAGNTIVTSVNAVVWDGTQFIAAGESSGTKVMTSANGTSWTNITSFIMTTIYDVAYNGRMYVMVGTGGGSIQTNTSGPSGGTWTGWNTRTGLSVGYGVAWNGSMWVAVGEKDSGGSTIIYSTDGATWTNATDFFSSRGRKVAWNGIYWIAVGQGTNTVARSTDGITWTNVTPGGFTAGYDVAWNGTIWVIVGTSSPAPIYYSYDGITWSATGDPIFTTEAFSVTWTGRQFVVTGSGTNNYATSPNGVTWTARGTLSGFTAGKSIGYSHLTTSDFILPNLNIYSRNTPNYLLSTNQILVQESSMTLNHTLTINKDSDFVGIRNANPQYELDVNGVINTSTMRTTNIQNISGSATSPSYTFAGDTNTGIYRPGADDIAITTAGSERMRINYNGNVGIGTTNPIDRLHVEGNIYAAGVIQMPDGSASYPSYSFINSPSNGLYYAPTTEPELINLGKTDAVHVAVAGQHRVEFNEAGVNSFGGYWAQDYNLTDGSSQGNVTVLKPYYTDSSYQGTVLYSYNNLDGTDRFFTIEKLSGGAIAKFDIPNSRLRIGDGENPTETLDVAGNAIVSGSVGIGTTTPDANYRLTVASAGLAGSIKLDGTNNAVIDNARIRGVNGSSSSPTFSFFDDENTGMYSAAADTLSLTTAGTEKMRITSGGTVSVNSTTPNTSYKMFVKDDMMIASGGNTPGGGGAVAFGVGEFFGQRSAMSQIKGVLENSPGTSTELQGGIAFSTRPSNDISGQVMTERMRIRSNGNIGIGTASPSARLDITGKQTPSLWVAAGYGLNPIVTSTDGITWTPRTTNLALCRGVAWNGSYWVAVGQPNGNAAARQIITSPDGITWTNRQSPFNSVAHDIAWNGSLWVAVGNVITSGENTFSIATSSDGITWTLRGAGIFTTGGYGIAWNGSYWVAGGQGTNSIATSPDGITWTGRESSVISSVYDIAWNGRMWAAVGTGTNTIATSTDGISWTGLGASIFTTSGYGVAWNGSLWVAVGGGTNSIATSTDGINWVGCGTSTFTGWASDIDWNGSYWVAGGYGTNSIATSFDGITWTGRISPVFSGTIRGVAWNSSYWIAVGEGGNTIARSTDGISWTGISGSTSILTTSGNTVTFGNGTWIAGGQASFATSTDGNNWTTYLTTALATWFGILYLGGTTWIAVGGGMNTIVRSTNNGTSWSAVSGTTFLLFGRGVATGNGRLVAVGNGGNTILTSTNGTSWLAVSGTTFTTSGNGVAFGVVNSAPFWVAVGQGGNTILTSTNGTSWSAVSGTTFTTAGNGVAFNNNMETGRWVAVGSGTSAIMTSTNGTTWTECASPLTIGQGVAWNGSLWVAVGNDGIIVTSTDGINWTGRSVSLSQANGIAWSADLQPDFKANNFSAFTQGVPNYLTSTPQMLVTSNRITYNNVSTMIVNGQVGIGTISPAAKLDITGKLGPNLWVATGGVAITSSAIIPTMTAATTSGFTITGNEFSSSFSPWKACDGNSSTDWAVSGTSVPQTWTVTCPSAYYVTRIEISKRTNGECYDGFFFEGSSDGTNWTTLIYSAPGILSSIGYGSGQVLSINVNDTTYTAYSRYRFRFISVGSGTNPGAAIIQLYGITQASVPSPTNTLATSTNGITWTGLGRTIFSIRANGVAWNGYLWVAVGAGGNTIATSPDGISWTGRGTSVFSTVGNGVAWNGSLWVAVGQGTNTIATSPDGITWTAVSGSTSVFSAQGMGVAWNGSLWVAVGQGTNTIATSTNGTTWTGRGVSVLTSYGNDVVWNGRLWVAVGQGTNTIAISSDGVTWAGLGRTIFSDMGKSIAWNGDLFVSVGQGTNTIATSTDGISWTGRGTSVFSTKGVGVAWNGSLWVATGEGTNTIATSTNGTTWTSRGTTISSGTHVAWSADQGPDFKANNISVFTQGVPNFLTNTPQMLVTQSTITFNNISAFRTPPVLNTPFTLTITSASNLTDVNAVIAGIVSMYRRVSIMCVGGGGGGSGGAGWFMAGGGGGGSGYRAYSENVYTSLFSLVGFSIGTGGNGGYNDSSQYAGWGSDGGQTWITSLQDGSRRALRAYGGLAGQPGNQNNNGNSGYGGSGFCGGGSGGGGDRQGTPGYGQTQNGGMNGYGWRSGSGQGAWAGAGGYPWDQWNDGSAFTWGISQDGWKGGGGGGPFGGYQAAGTDVAPKANCGGGGHGGDYGNGHGPSAGAAGFIELTFY